MWRLAAVVRRDICLTRTAQLFEFLIPEQLLKRAWGSAGCV